MFYRHGETQAPRQTPLLLPCLLGTIQIVRPETVLRWHRSGFRAYWRWKSRNRGGRPKIERELRDLIRRMSKENPLWGAPRIHGELRKLGFENWPSRRSRSTWSEVERRPPRAGRHFCATRPMASPRSISAFPSMTIKVYSDIFEKFSIRFVSIKD